MKRKNLIRRLTMPLPELEAYYRLRRKECFEADAPFRGVALRRAIHPVLVAGMKIKHRLDKQAVTLLSDRRIPTHRPVIFAGTHIGWDDIEMILSAIGDHAYLFWGDPKESYQTVDGFLVDLNGSIVCDTRDKTDRYIGKETCVKWLSRGGNLLIFPEGAWNITECLPIMPLYAGTAEMALRTGADIVPVAIERFGRDYTVNIGANIPAEGDKFSLTQTIRDSLATLKWEIWSSRPQEQRAEIPADHYRQQLQQTLTESYTMEDIEATRFRSPAENAQREVESVMEQLIPCRENAFLLRKYYETEKN